VICSTLLIELWHTPRNLLIGIASKTSCSSWIDFIIIIWPPSMTNSEFENKY
jgi:hypothetical protein